MMKMPASDSAIADPIADRPRWIRTKPGLPYFLTEDGDSWTPIGQNDAISWPELAGLFRRRDLAGVEAHLRRLKAHGVTCLRLMLEYCQVEHRYLERPAGSFAPNMVRLWDDLFAMLERVGLHVLLTPYDTFFMWVRWKHHPYNRANGGMCASRQHLLQCPDTRAAIKARLRFATDRWGASPALFAWDIWNEMHPAHGRDDPSCFTPFIDDVGGWLRAYEIERHGRAHLQTVSIFGPELVKHPELAEPIFRHPGLDFANTHLYEHGTIDDPKNTVAPAISAGRLIRLAVNDARDLRPVFDSEHGPIHRFKDKKRTLPAAFDDEYFRHIQWAHLASGGAGGGMRWPNRHPHVLTAGMREAQAILSAFLPRIDWRRFRRRNISEGLVLAGPPTVAFGCASEDQAVVWLLRTDRTCRDGRMRGDGSAEPVTVTIPGLDPGRYTATCVDTASGTTNEAADAICADGLLTITTSFLNDTAIAISRSGEV
jgi:mannan endo-1,4-beta-mannosidase